MSRSVWSGHPPSDDNDAKLRLGQAALRCVANVGLQKTTMSDIAKEAGVARPTLYKHFKNKTEAMIFAIDAASLEFAHSVETFGSQFDSAEERIIQTILFVVEEFPRQQYLSLVLDPDLSHALAERAFVEDATLRFSRIAIGPVIALRPDLRKQREEIAEVMSRFAISLILFPGRFKNSRLALRRFIQRRILPGLV
jgi:AcrR family transcriptional regulator